VDAFGSYRIEQTMRRKVFKDRPSSVEGSYRRSILPDLGSKGGSRSSATTLKDRRPSSQPSRLPSLVNEPRGSDSFVKRRRDKIVASDVCGLGRGKRDRYVYAPVAERSTYRESDDEDSEDRGGDRISCPEHVLPLDLCEFTPSVPDISVVCHPDELFKSIRNRRLSAKKETEQVRSMTKEGVSDSRELPRERNSSKVQGNDRECSVAYDLENVNDVQKRSTDEHAKLEGRINDLLEEMIADSSYSHPTGASGQSRGANLGVRSDRCVRSTVSISTQKRLDEIDRRLEMLRGDTGPPPLRSPEIRIREPSQVASPAAIKRVLRDAIQSHATLSRRLHRQKMFSEDQRARLQTLLASIRGGMG